MAAATTAQTNHSNDQRDIIELSATSGLALIYKTLGNSRAADELMQEALQRRRRQKQISSFLDRNNHSDQQFIDEGLSEIEEQINQMSLADRPEKRWK